MRIALITGGAGFIGSHIAKRLLEKDWQVRIIDNESTGKRENLPKGCWYLKGDIRNLNDLDHAFGNRVDVVFHLAAQVSNILSLKDPHEDVTTNIIGTLNVLNQCRKKGVERLLYASSMALYGQPIKMPVKESAPLKPLSYYGISKLATENYVMSTLHRKDMKLNVTALRMFNVYGPRQSLTNPYQGVISVFISNVMNNEPITLYGSGRQSRDFIYIDDVINVWMKSIDAESTYCRTFNVGSGYSTSINLVIDEVLLRFGYTRENYQIINMPELFGDQFQIEADVQLIAKLIGWQPKTSIKNGLEKTIEWARMQNSK